MDDFYITSNVPNTIWEMVEIVPQKNSYRITAKRNTQLEMEYHNVNYQGFIVTTYEFTFDKKMLDRMKKWDIPLSVNPVTASDIRVPEVRIMFFDTENPEVLEYIQSYKFNVGLLNDTINAI